MAEILVIFLIVIILFGPSQLPKLARGLGEAMREFRRASSELDSKPIEPKEEKNTQKAERGDEK